MGQRMSDEPIDYGDDCLPCFAASKTPEFVYVRFGLIQPCSPPGAPTCRLPPNDRVFKLPQSSIHPCRYFYDGTVWKVHVGLWQTPPGPGWLRLEDVDANIYFEQEFPVCPDEGTVYHNSITGCVGIDCVTGGIGIITWNPQATQLLEDINLDKADDLFMELRPLENGKLVYKFCKLQDATNISILFEP